MLRLLRFLYYYKAKQEKKMDICEQFKENGFALINKEKVLEDIKEFYFDIAKFFSIILEDDNRFIHHVHKIRGAVETKDIISIDKAFQNAMLAVQSKDRKLLSKLYDMGTRPNKFISGEKLFSIKKLLK